MPQLMNNLTTGQPRRVLVYLNGVEVPCESVSQSWGVWRFPELTIDLPPDPLLQRIGADDKIQAAAFYLDTNAYDKPTYCLLGEGEVVTWSYSRTGNSRRMSLHCVDPIATLTQLFLHYITDVNAGLGNTIKTRQGGAAGNVIMLSALPLGFFYEALRSKGGKTINRPVDLLLNIIGSVTGFVEDTPVYSNKKELLNLVTNAQKAAAAPKVPKAQEFYEAAKNVVGGGQPSYMDADEGPTKFSKTGLVRYALNQVNVRLPTTGVSAQQLYDYCVSKGTVTTNDLGAKVTGALMFESYTSSPKNVTSVGIVGPAGEVIEVLTVDTNVSGDDGFHMIHQRVAQHESLGDAGMVVADANAQGSPRGISVGLLNHNQRLGTLYEIMQEMKKTNRTKFNAVMGPTDLDVFDDRTRFRKYPFYARKDYWYAKFRQLFSDPEMVAVQYAYDKLTYFKPVVDLARSKGFAVIQHVAMLMDANVQFGFVNTKKMFETAIALKGSISNSHVMAHFYYLADRRGFNAAQLAAGKTWRRRRRLFTDFTLSDKKAISFEGAPSSVKSGIRVMTQQQDYRRIVGYALVPGLDYASFLPAGSKLDKTTKASSDKGSRLRNLQIQKNQKILSYLQTTYTVKATYTKAQKQSGEVWFNKTFPEHKRQEATARSSARSQKVKEHALHRAKAAIHFFMRWAQVTKIKDKIIACPSFDATDNGRDYAFPVLKAMNMENLAKAVVQYTQYASGTSGSVWDFIRQVFQVMLFELLCITAPSAYTVDAKKNILALTDKQIEGTLALGTYLAKPQMFFSLPPSCNVVFPSLLEQFNYQENYATQPTRTYMGDPTQSTMLGVKRNSSLTYLANTKAAYPPQVDASLFDNKGIAKNNKDLVVFPAEYYKGPITNRRQAPTWMYFLYQELKKKSLKNLQRKASEGAIKIDTSSVATKVSDRGVVYSRSGQSFSLSYVDDTPSDSRAPSFSQNGYFRGQPLRFTAMRIEGGTILHARAAEDYTALKKAAKLDGFAMTASVGFLTAAEQVAVGSTKSSERPGYSKHQIGAQIRLNVQQSKNEKLQAWLAINAGKYNFVAMPNETLVSKRALIEVAKTLQTSNQAVLKPKSLLKSPIYLNHALNRVVLDILYARGAKLTTAQRDPAHRIYATYAKYEHFREVYGSRTAAGSGVFDPYLVAGFPMYVLDGSKYAMNIAGYLTSGTHSISNAGRSNTTWNTVQNRTFNEMFELINMNRKGLPVAPEDPIDDVRDTTQQLAEARNFYKHLFYGNTDFRGKDPLGDYQNIVGWGNVHGSPDTIGADAKKDNYNINREYDREIQPLPTALNLYNDTNAALAYCARPVCTMEQYISFYGGVRRTAAHPGDSLIADGSTNMPFYYQIRDFAYGAGITADPTEEGISQMDEYTRLKAMPPTLRNWQRSLLLYRQKIYANDTE